MAEKQVEVDTIVTFPDDDYGWVNAHERRTVRADVAERWIAEDKARPVPVLVEKRGIVETPEDALPAHETADLKRRRNV